MLFFCFENIDFFESVFFKVLFDVVVFDQRLLQVSLESMLAEVRQIPVQMEPHIILAFPFQVEKVIIVNVSRVRI